MHGNLITPILLFLSICAKAYSPTPDPLLPHQLTELAKAKINSHLDSSLLLLHSALDQYQKLDSLEAYIEACKDLGVAFDMAGNLQLATDIYQLAEAKNLWRTPQSTEEWEALGWLHANAGYTQSWYGNYFAAKEQYEEAHHIFEQKVRQLDATDVAYVHRELGNLYTRFGEHEAAKLMLERTQQVALDHGETNLAAEAANDLGIAYTDHGEHEKAIKICQEALAQSGLNTVSKALLEVTLATAFSETDELEEARRHADIAESLLQAVIKNSAHPNGPLWLSNLMKLQGHILKDPKSAAQALERSQHWLSQVYPDTMRREFAKLRLAEAQFYLKNNRPQEALRKQQAALQTVLYRYSEPDPTNHPNPAYFYPENTILEALAGKAKSFRQLFEETGERDWLNHALFCHDLIFEAERAYRQVHHFESSKLTLLTESSQRTESALDAAWLLFEKFGDEKALEKAFEFSEKSKSILLFEALRHSGASSIANVPDDLLVQERQLRESLAEVEKKLFFKEQKSDTSGFAQLNLKILELTASIQSLVAKMEEEHPAFFATKNGKSSISIEDAKAMLRPGQALLEYFIGQEHLYIFLIKKEGLVVERVAKDFPLEKWVTEFRGDIEAFQFPQNDRSQLCENYSHLGHALYQKLFEPVEKYQLPADLVIIPGGILGFLPFDALLTEKPAAACVLKKYPYLVRQHKVAYSYSATLLQMLQAKESHSNSQPFAGFGPAFPEDNSSGFGKLDGNVASVSEIAALMNGQLFVNEVATRQVFLDQVSSFEIIYLATHAKANTDKNGFSFIVLADEDGTAYDSLFVKDIYNLPDLKAELVFLGACETGSGKWYDGEGIISLARSFLFAGAKSIVTTLWSINDESNRELTRHFFANLKEGQGKDEALWKAKLAVLENDRPDLYAHPVFWAAYTPIGNMEPISSKFPWWWLGAGLAGVAVAFGWRKMRNS